MDMFDEARAIEGTLALCKLTQKKLADQLGVSQSYIANKLRLLGFSDSIVTLIRESGISERHARSILRLDSEEMQREIIKKVASHALTVRECEALVDASVDVNAPTVIGKAEIRKRTDTFIDTLKRSIDTLVSLGTDVKLRRSYYGTRTYLTIVIEE